MLKIGVSNSKTGLRQAQITQTELAKIGLESEVVPLETAGDLKKIEAALLRGECDLAVHTMTELPPQTPGSPLVIAAVSERGDASEWLVFRPDATEEGKILKLKTSAVVGASTDLRQAQLLQFRPDFLMKKLDGEVAAWLEKMRTGELDAVVLAGAEVSFFDLELADFQIIKINPQEFVPAPAQGVLAWRTHRDDLATRRILKKIHHPEVSVASNVERRVLQLLAGENELPPGVFCERDAAGWLHCFAVWQTGSELRRARVSQSTSVGMAEKVVEKLRS